MQAIDALPNFAEANFPGIYLEVQGRAAEPFVTKSLDASGLKLLSVKPAAPDQDVAARATVFALATGLKKLRSKIEDFQENNTPKGRPKNADLVQSIAAIVEAGLLALWRSPARTFPIDGVVRPWEIWLDRENADRFVASAIELGIEFEGDRLDFPEDTVVVGHCTREVLALAVRHLGCVKALAAPTVISDFFDGMPIEEQIEWTEALRGLIRQPVEEQQRFITLLDSGITLSHPLIQPFLSRDDRHAALPAWAVDDSRGHGTQLAGLALFGDLYSALQGMLPVTVRHRLESSKVIPDAGQNPHHLLGAVVRNAINAVELRADRRRTFVLASTTEEDTPHDGAPTSWSSETDQLASGVSGEQRRPRLLIVSAGNTDQNRFVGGNYLDVCDHDDHEIESPAQAWNPICVGAYTTKTRLPLGLSGQAVAPLGDLSPSSRTASWASHWPIKPDVVMEGGNWVHHGAPPPLRHPALSVLTTDHRFPGRSFTTTGDTSAATALAAREVTELWSDYPDLWPETIRGLFVSSARWTPGMIRHLPANPRKGDYTPLFQRYGYGVPDSARARRSAGNAVTLIVQDSILPYRSSTTRGADPVHNEMKLFQLPWPRESLRALQATPVTLRVTLSTFIQPNPSEAARGSKYRYASHNLRFKLNRANENEAQLRARISRLAEEPDIEAFDENDGWVFGPNRRDVGSIHIDEFRGPASDLARRNLLAVHPITGWWKSKSVPNPQELPARFALIVELDAGEAETELYAEVAAAIANINVAEVGV